MSTISQSEAGPSRRRRKYATQACNTCRRRKTKCDGTQPTCQPCTSSGHECSWSTDGNENNRPATKQYIEGLRAKIRMLESEIAELKQSNAQTNRIRPPDTQVVNEPAAAFTIVQPHISPPESQPYPSTPSTLSVRADPSALNVHLHHSHNYHIQHHTIQPTQPSSNSGALHEPDNIPSSPVYHYIFNLDSITPEERSPEHIASLECRWNRHLPEFDSIQLTRHEHDMLLSRCFSYGAAWILGLLPDLFLRDMLEFLKPTSTRVPGELHFYSPLLHCSLLAFASPLSDDARVRAKSTRERFAVHGKQWLDEEFGYSNPSLILSLILLSEYHLGIGELHTGYMYIGMGMRATRMRSGPNPLVRDWYRWSTFIQENLIALEMRRPSEMPEPDAPILPPITIELSGRSTAGDSVDDMLTHADYIGISAHCFMQSVKLVLISSAIPTVSQRGTAVIDLHLQFDTWFNALPDGLLVRQRATLTQPPILALHIRYWWSMLDLHLPFVNSLDHATIQPTKMCNRATEKLIKLFGAYDTQFGFRYFPQNLLKAMHTCGRALVYERSQFSEKTKKRTTAQEGIEMCLKGLSTAGEIWTIGESLAKDLEALLADSDTTMVDSA